LLGLIATVRTWRAVLLADEHGITIRNTWTTKSWAWDEIGEVGWEPTALARGLMVAISVCPFGDPYTHLATATGTGLGQLRQVVVPLRPLLKHHGVSDAMDRETATVLQWSDDPRSRHGTRAGDRNATR
jgi:hypothetical protein